MTTAIEDSRLSAVEQSIVRIDAVLPTLATKFEVGELRSEMHKGFAEMVKWIVGTAFVGIAAFVTIMTFVLNNAVPHAPAQPTVIVIPAPAKGTP